MKPRVKRTVSIKSKVGLKKQVETTKAMLSSLKEKLDETTNVKNMMMAGANKATELFERATTENRLTKAENEELKKENEVLKKNVMSGLVKIKDMEAAHEYEACDWITEKGALEKELEHERALNLKLEHQLAIKRGKILVLEDEKRLLESRGILERIFRVGEAR